MSTEKNAKRELTPRQRELVKQLATGQSQKSAAIKAGYSPKAADQSAYQAIQQIKKKMPQLIDEKGLTDEALIEKYLVPLLEATQVKAFSHEGRVIYSKPLEALDIRLRALEQAFKLKGSYAPPQEAAQANVGVRVILMDKLPRPDRTEFYEAQRKQLEQQKIAIDGNKATGNEPKQ